MADRYCSTCGQELRAGGGFCPGCGRPSHATAQVPTPEANVPIPPVQAPTQPRQDLQHGRAKDVIRGPKWGMLVVFLVLIVGRTAMELPPASYGDFASRLGYGMAIPIILALGLAVLILFIGGVYYVTGRKDGVTFSEAIFNWPMVILAGGVVFLAII